MSLIKNIQIPFKLLKLTFYRFSKFPKDIPFYFDWILSLKNKKNGRNTFTDQRLWLTYRAIRWLSSFLKEEMTVFEYGSGGSTIFLAQRVKRVVSVEHNEQWYQLVGESLNEFNLSNVEYFLKEPEKMKLEGDFCDPCSYASGIQHKFERMSFCEYVKVIDNYPDRFFDMVLIDGRARPSCIMHAVKKIKKSGIIVLDNSDRERYKLAKIQYLSNYKFVCFFGIVPYSTQFAETAIFVKGDE